MNRRSGASRRLCNAAALAVAALTMALPATAAAEHARSERDRYDRYDRRDSRHDGRRDSRHDGRHHDNSRRDFYYGGVFGPHFSHHRRHRMPRYARGVHYRHAKAFYCEPCRHAFDSRNAFHRHIHRRHRVPMWRVPFAAIHHALGWVFHG
jgi:hypothetical protein